MSPATPPSDPFDTTMLDLFCAEIEMQGGALNEGLIQVERTPKEPKLLEKLMRSAHSIKGAARVLGLEPIVRLSHAMEDFFVAAQRGQAEVTPDSIDHLLRCTDFLLALSKVKAQEISHWIEQQLPQIESLMTVLAGEDNKYQAELPQKSIQVDNASEVSEKEAAKENKAIDEAAKVLRITAENLNRLMGLAGESLVETKWLPSFSSSLKEIKKNCYSIEDLLSILRENIDEQKFNHTAQEALGELYRQIHLLTTQYGDRVAEFDTFIWRHGHLSDRLYHEVVKSRMRPFSDGIEPFPRLVRDLARQLGKEARLEIDGKATLVDRDILEKLEAPLGHLIRNALDHGIESPQERLEAGKLAEGVIKLEAHHQAGMLDITLSDDGRGIDLDRLRKKIIEKKLSTEEMISRFSEQEIIEFLFLPGFSTTEKITDVSGRGVGLDVVRTVMQTVGGRIYTQSVLGKGTAFYLQLPLTLSVIRALLVEVGGEAYAFPLARIEHACHVQPKEIKSIESRQFYRYEGQNVGLVPAWEVFNLQEPHLMLDALPVVVLSDRLNRYGVVVDKFIGEKELVLQELDPRLGKVPETSAGAIMEDGSPILVVDVDDMIRSIDYLLSGGRLARISGLNEGASLSGKKRILVVDDSATVREVECRLLLNSGYAVETAVDGADGWNAVRSNSYDLVITDIDMPRMNGIEFLQAIKNDAKLQGIPVMIISYKESEEERRRGLEAGAERYLTKSSFRDASLLKAVQDLIGESS